MPNLLFTLRRLSRPLVVAGAFAATCGLAAANDPPVGFISAVRGQPTIVDAAGASRALKPLQPIQPGSRVTLTGADSLDLCHESAATAFRVEGAGDLAIEPGGVTPLTATLKVTARGRCGRSVPPSVPGGVLLRRVQPAPAQ